MCFEWTSNRSADPILGFSLLLHLLCTHFRFVPWTFHSCIFAVSIFLTFSFSHRKHSSPKRSTILEKRIRKGKHRESEYEDKWEPSVEIFTSKSIFHTYFELLLTFFMNKSDVIFIHFSSSRVGKSRRRRWRWRQRKNKAAEERQYEKQPNEGIELKE